MLSVCIPIYNYNVTALVEGLLEQAPDMGVPYEIVLIDDHSSQEYIGENSKLQGANVKYIQLDENIGRAKIRNRFLKEAKYDYLLFFDCDSKLMSSGFLQAYLMEIQRGEKVVCGGRVYPAEPPAHDKMLHWKYGRYKESQPVAVRVRNPYRSFMTNNFMVERKVLEEIKFDERLSGYGHEDTLFGYELKKRNISIKHIDNPILHGELQTNAEFLEKTENAIANLKKVLEYVHNDKAFIQDVSLLRTYLFLNKSAMLFLARAKFVLLRPLLKRLLLGRYPNMTIFSFYKLGCFITG